MYLQCPQRTKQSVHSLAMNRGVKSMDPTDLLGETLEWKKLDSVPSSTYMHTHSVGDCNRPGFKSPKTHDTRVQGLFMPLLERPSDVSRINAD